MSLFPTILLVCGKVNFTNLSRYSEYSEKTYRRHYSQGANFVGFNVGLIRMARRQSATVIGGMDCSFIPKSGKATYGLDYFYNGSASCTEKGLEISVIAVIDVEDHQGYSLSVKQTPAHLAPLKEKVPSQNKRITWEVIESLQQMLAQLPDKTETGFPVEAVALELTRIDYYLEQLKATRPYFPDGLKYLSVDGFYSKKKFVDGVVALDLQMVGKLRSDANLRYLYRGPQKPRGAKRKYDGKVDLSQLERFSHVRQLEAQLNLYTTIVWHVSLKRQIRLACLVDTRKVGKVGVALLFSTDIELDAERILEYYKARFQIEFIFRDAKQFTGLCDAQSRDPQRLDFHFNASLTTLNLVKCEHQLCQQATDAQPQSSPFSMSTYKRIAFNDHLLERFISQLALNPTLIKSHPNYENLRSYGIIGT